MMMKNQIPAPFSMLPSKGYTCRKWDFCHHFPADSHWIFAKNKATVVLWELLKRKVWVWRQYDECTKIASLISTHKTECRLKYSYLNPSIVVRKTLGTKCLSAYVFQTHHRKLRTMLKKTLQSVQEE